METTTTTHTMRTLHAAPGHRLIECDALAAATAEPQPGQSAPYMPRTVHLGAADTPGRYTEITDAEAAEIEARYQTQNPQEDETPQTGI